MRRTWLWWLLVVVVVLVVPGGAAVVLVVGRLKRADFLKLVADEVAAQVTPMLAARDDQKPRRVAAIVAAQAALETNNGATPGWLQGWNFGNITAGTGWTGAVVEGGDTEPDASGKYVPIVARFRKYGSLAESVSDFLALLSWSRYRPARDALFAEDVNGYLEKLRAGGYYTAPLADYVAGTKAALEAARSAAGVVA